MVSKIILSILFLFYYKANAAEDRNYYPNYHLAPPHGFMNDPSGLCIFNGSIHLFYQHNPDSSSEPGTAHWRQAKSINWFDWEDLGIALYPDQSYDSGGVFTGSAIVEKKKESSDDDDDEEEMFLFYSANVNYDDEPEKVQSQAMAKSSDAVNFVKYNENPIIEGSKSSPNTRDPRVWKHEDTYYMVIGNSFDNNTLGRILLFSSKNKIDWEQVSVLGKSDGELGYMWECPDFFELNGKHVLLFSPQGVKPQGDKYRNLYQLGYFVGDYNQETGEYKVQTPFKELDHGHDIYASLTADINGKRVVIAWSDMWGTNYPEIDDNFKGQMTLPRVLSLTDDNILLQTPVSEIAEARGQTIYSDRAKGGTEVTLNDNAAEIIIVASSVRNLKFYIESDDETKTVSVEFDAIRGRITFNRGGDDGIRRTEWRPSGLEIKCMIYIDKSSFELFCGSRHQGEVTFTSRIFPVGKAKFRLDENSSARTLKVTDMKKTLYLNAEK